VSTMGEPASAERTAPGAARIECVGVHAMDRRRVDVAVDLAYGPEPLTIEMVIVGPGDQELCSVLLVHTRELMLDKVMHLHSDAEPGEHTLHVGLFRDEELLDHAIRRFSFLADNPQMGP
jgi:hypothetical protein